MRFFNAQAPALHFALHAGDIADFYNTVDIISDFEFKTTDDGGKKTAEALREVSLPGPTGLSKSTFRRS